MKRKYQHRLMSILSIFLVFTFMFVYVGPALTSNGNANAISASPVNAVSSATTAAITAITVTSASDTVLKGKTLQMNALVKPIYATNRKVSWSVVNATGSATISDTGLLSAIKAGTVTVIARDYTARIKGMKVITVISAFVAVSSIVVSSASNIVVRGKALQMSGLVMPTNATNKKVNWSVVNATGAATINANGLLSASKVGIVKVIARDYACIVKGYKVITVTAPVAIRSITVTSTSNTVANGKTLKMSASILPANATNKKVGWFVVNATGSATISTAGLLTASGEGTVTVVARDIVSNVKGMKVITITAAEVLTFEGYIQDQDCFIQYTPSYGADTRMCLLMHSCAASGYGITALQSNGTFKFYYFDGDFANYLPWSIGTGSQLMAWNLITATQKKNHVTIKVTGTLNGDSEVSPFGGINYPVITVTSIEEVATSPVLTSIAVTTPATKLTYNVGDALDITGLIATGSYVDNTLSAVPITTADVSGFDSTESGDNQILTITYGGKTATYAIDVIAAPVVVVPKTSITVTGAGDATTVINGSILQMSALVMPADATNKAVNWSVVDATGTATINAEGLLTAAGVGTVTVVARDPASNVKGMKVITVTAPLEILTFEGYIQDQHCFVKKAPTYGSDSKMCLLMHSCASSGYGITALENDGTFKFYYFDGDFAINEPWSIGTSSQSDAWNLCTATSKAKHVTIKITGTLNGDAKAPTLGGTEYPVITVTSMEEVTASPVLTSIAVTTPATKLTYTVGDALDIAGLAVTGYYVDTTSEVASTITAANVTGFDSILPAANQILTITYGGKTATYTVDVVAAPAEILTFTGFIQDQDCFSVSAPNYGDDTKTCLLMESCAASGYGITAEQNGGSYKFYYFDGDFANYLPWSVGTGSQLASWNLINATTKVDHITISVSGTLNGNTKISPYDGLPYPVITVSTLTETN